MRKKSFRKNTLLPSMSLNHQRINSEPIINEEYFSIPHPNSIEKYQKELNRSQHAPAINFRVNKKTAINLNEEVNRSKVIKSLVKATSDITNLKEELTNSQYSYKTRTDSKLQQFMSKLTDSINQQKIQSKPSFQQPLYYPIPMPFPMHLPQIPQNNLQHKQNSSTKTFSRNDSFYLQNNEIRNKELKKSRIRRNIRKWRKVGNCVLFILYLKRFNKMAQISRQSIFNRNINKIKSSLTLIRKRIIQNITHFQQTLLLKKQVQFDILDDDRKEIIKQKASSIRKLVGMLLQGLLEFAKQNKNQVAVIEAFYYLCKHGNYSCKQPLLTQEEMELTCISSAFRYVSAEKYLQKAALINVIFFKLLLFNSLLSFHRLDSQFSEETISNNLYVISSVIYELAIDVQDQYMLKVPNTYTIGNYEKFSEMRILESIVIGNNPKRPSELISGLKSQEWIKKYFNFRGWHEQKQSLMTIIDIIQSSMAQLHRKLTKKCY